MKNIESKIQQGCIRWFDMQYPKLKQLCFHIANGGKRGIITAMRMKKEGVRKGIPDIFLSIPRGNHCGLYCEVKTVKGRLTPEQKSFFDAVGANYKCVIVRSVDEFMNEINNYLK